LAVKIFLHDINRAYYRGNPADTFEMEINYAICLSTGLGPDSDPHTEEGSMLLQFPVSSSPNEVYARAWDEIITICTTNGWEVPTKADVYCWLPTTFSQLLPE